VRKTLHFRPSARLQSILSRELVADPNVALLEFVKNGYDAHASEVLVQFELAERAREGVIYIADNGDGMNLENFEDNWMRPGYSQKANFVPKPGKRVPVGEKGLGRLAAGRLGETLDVWTRRTRRDSWLHAHFEWGAFEDMDRDLAQIGVPVDDQTPPELTIAETGTIVRIGDLRLNWNARVPGRRAPGRATTRLGRLRQDLELLLLPLGQGDDEFAIELEHNSSLPEDESGSVEPPALQLLDYQYDFALAQSRGSWRIRRSLRRSPAIAAETSQPATTKLEGALPPILGDPAEIGTFEGTMYYAPHSARRLRELRAPIGVRLYRDGVRVDPFGDDPDDWLGARARKASRQGHAAIQPNALYGAVRLTRAGNPSLVPMANREGMVENEAFESFVAICQSEFSFFEDRVFQELVEPNWTSLESKRQEEAEQQQAFAFTLARTAAHAVRQPVAGANAELDRLQGVLKRVELPANERARLQEVHDRTLAHLQRIEAAVQKMLEVLDFNPEVEAFTLDEAVASIVGRLRNDARSAKVSVDLEIEAPGIQVELPRDVLELALDELVQNAIHAPRPSGRQGHVEVVVGLDKPKSRRPRPRISVIDNGSGVPEAMREDLFMSPQSTKGRIGFGLILTRQLMRLARGDVRLASTGAEGSRFEVMLSENGAP
jgi:signal transduction histidine kinase